MTKITERNEKIEKIEVFLATHEEFGRKTIFNLSFWHLIRNGPINFDRVLSEKGIRRVLCTYGFYLKTSLFRLLTYVYTVWKRTFELLVWNFIGIWLHEFCLLSLMNCFVSGWFPPTTTINYSNKLIPMTFLNTNGCGWNWETNKINNQ